MKGVMTETDDEEFPSKIENGSPIEINGGKVRKAALKGIFLGNIFRSCSLLLLPQSLHCSLQSFSILFAQSDVESTVNFSLLLLLLPHSFISFHGVACGKFQLELSRIVI